ncbi:MAG: hypothetical protein HY910_03675 [Desulfarculus sp.]|nr:hypothetical protein [Desulfarculus sp.]
MTDLSALAPLRRAWDYAAPRRPAECLPMVYGDMQGGNGPLWNAVCLDTAAHVYALAGHPLLDSAAGNQVTLYASDGQALDPASYSLDLCHDFQDRGLIATATLNAEAGVQEPMGVRAQGKPGPDSQLITNPLEVAEDFLVGVCGLNPKELDQGALSRSRGRAAARGFRASGLINQPKAVASLLTEIMSTFLGSWWRGGDGRLRLYLDLGPGSASDGELAAMLGQAHLKDVSVSARLADVVNRAVALYCKNYRNNQYEAGHDGLASQDPLSIALYGPQARTLELPWVRDAATATALAAALVRGFRVPRRVITCQEDALANLSLEKGDLALLSLDWLYDGQGQPLVNRMVRVLGLEPQLDKGTIAFTLLDTGFHKTKALLADGSAPADGRELAGGGRDRTEYQA